MVVAVALWAGTAGAQTPVTPAVAGNAPAAAQAQLDTLQAAVAALQAQLLEAQREADEMRQALRVMRAELDVLRRGASAAGEAGASGAQDQDLLAAKVDQQEQTKVESGSKYRVRLSGLALMSAVSTFGSVDSLDLPELAVARPAGESGGTFSMSLRQSVIGLDVFGPTIGGAKTSAGLKLDFFGGFTDSVDGLSSPHARLRTAHVTFEGEHYTLVAGQETPFVSPLSPTSMAQNGYAGLSAAGNLWTWTPEVYLERRLALGTNGALVIQGGVLDALTGEEPANEYVRMPTAGERSRLPAEAVRVGWRRTEGTRVTSVAGSAYFSRQRWGFDRRVNSWAVMTDWEVPLGPRTTFTGELYRGRAAAGLGGGASASVLMPDSAVDPAGPVLALDRVGGWSQISFTPEPRVVLNAAFGRDRAFRQGLQEYLTRQPSAQGPVRRNTSAFVNAIVQARSNLLFAVELRRLWTTDLDQRPVTAHQLSLSTGVGF